jgi:hypothetical protein
MNTYSRSLRPRLRELARRLRLTWSLRSLERRRPILIYQMGKVGSSSVVDLLHQLNLNRPIIHVHTLNPEHLETAVERHRQASQRPLDEHLVASSIMLRQLQLSELPCQIITLTRAPIARTLSFVLEDWSKKIPDARSATLDGCVEMAKAAVNKMLQPGSAHADPSTWFDSELRSTFGVDVFSRPYDLNHGYTILPHELHPTLVIRMEDLNRSLSPAIREFLGVDVEGVRARPANRGADKWYAEVYEALKQTYALEPDALKTITTSRYFKHFYTDHVNLTFSKWGSQRLKALTPQSLSFQQ